MTSPTGAVQRKEIGGWVLRQRVPSGDAPYPLMLMLHGWTGDENSMWVFASRLPKNALLVAPRAPYLSPSGGFSWRPYKPDSLATVEDFHPAAEALIDILSPVNFPLADLSRLRVMGFSQGAAMTYIISLLYPKSVLAFAGLSGFAPDGAISLAAGQPLRDVPAFIAHGSRDRLVPVERARRSVEVLQEAGAIVTYCEDDVGHKLSADCFLGMQRFFEQNQD
jgi:phospholipase/carboxylesterase